MALHGSYGEEFDDAFTIARRVQTSSGGFRTFQRHWPDLSKSDAKEIWNRVWPRAQRVKYFEDTPGGQFISRKKLGCSDSSSHLLVGHQITFVDQDGQQHEINVWTTTEIEQHIGTTRDLAYAAMLRSRALKSYFEGQAAPFINSQITSHRITQVKCLSAEF